jgi:hypothetical protein
MDHQSQRRSDGFSSKEIRNLQSLLKRKRAQTTITNEKERERERRPIEGKVQLVSTSP